MIGGDIKVVMTLDDRDFTVKTMRAGETLSTVRRQIDTTGRSMNSLEGGMTSLGSKMKDLIFTISLMRFAFRDIQDIFLGFPLSIAKAAGEFEKMTKLMEGLSKESSQAKRELEALAAKEYVIKLAMNSPFSINALSDAMVKLKTGGIDPTNGSLQALVDSVARFGGSEEQLKRAGVAIQQMAGKGVISMEELRQQLGEAVPDAMQMMADGLGMSMGKMINIISKGQLEAGPALERMFAVMAIRNEGQARRMMETWSGMTAQMSTRWELFKNEIGTAGGENSFLEELKRSFYELNSVFDSQEARAFAKDLGQTLKDIVIGVKDVVKFFIEWGDAIKVAGIALAAYFSAGKIGEIIGALRSVQAEAAKVVAGDKDARRGGLLQSVAESSLRERQATARRIEEIRKEYQTKIDLSKSMVAENEKLIATSLATERTAQAERLRLARAERAEKKELAASLMAEERALQAKRMEQYRTLIAAERQLRANENAAFAGAYSGAAGVNSKDLRAMEQWLAASRQAFSDTTRMIQAKRDEAKAIVDASNAKIADLRASKEYQAVSRSNVETLRASNVALSANIAGLTNHANATVQATIASRALNGVIAGARTIWTAFGGWVTVAIGVLFWAGEKLYEFMNRWKKASELIENIKSGMATQEGNDTLTERLKENAVLIERIDNQIAAKREIIANRQKLLANAVGENNKRALQQTLADEKIGLDYLLAQRKTYTDRATELEKNLADGRVQIQKAATSREVEQWMRLNEDSIEKKVAGLKDTDNRLRKEADALIEKAKRETPGITQDKLDELSKGKREEIAKNLAAINAARLSSWEADERTLRQQMTAASGATKVVIEEKLRLTMDQISRYKGIQDAASKLDTPVNLLGGNKPGKFKLDRTDPLTQLVNDSKAKLEDARLQLAQIKSGTNQLLSEQQSSAMDMLRKLANDDFDSKEDKKQPALATRGKYIDDFIEYIRSGKTDVEGFINSLEGLNVSMDKNGKTVRQNMIEVINNNVELKRQQEVIEALTKVRQIDAEVTERLNEAQTELAAGSDFISSSMLRLMVQFDKLGLKIDETQKRLIGFYEVRESLLLKQFSVENATEIRKLQDEIQKAQLSAMTDGRAKKEAEHAFNLSLIEKERAAKEEQLRKTTDNEIKFLVASVENNRRAALQIEAENLRYITVTKTEMQKLQESWKVTFDSIDTAATGWANSMMETLDTFVETGKLKFSDLFRSILKDIQKMALRNAIGDVVGSVAGTLGKAVGGMFGIDMSGLMGQKNELAKDPTTGALLVRNVTDATDKVAELTKGANAQTSFFDGLKNKFSDILSFLGNGFSDVISWIGTAISSIAGGVGGAGSGIIDGIASIASFFFADGGIMTSMGPASLRKYASGGIADSPQLAMFGEGDVPEAYVPLPDGRSIPVTMRGVKASQGPTEAPNVTVNVINQTNQQVTAQQTGQRFDGKQMILDVVMSGMSQPGPFRDNMKSSIENMKR